MSATFRVVDAQVTLLYLTSFISSVLLDKEQVHDDSL